MQNMILNCRTLVFFLFLGPLCLGSRVYGVGFRIQDLGFRVRESCHPRLENQTPPMQDLGTFMGGLLRGFLWSQIL